MWIYIPPRGKCRPHDGGYTATGHNSFAVFTLTVKSNFSRAVPLLRVTLHLIDTPRVKSTDAYA